LTPALFDYGTAGRLEPDFEDEALGHWFHARGLVAMLQTHRSTILPAKHAEDLRAALDFAHARAHEPCMEVSICPCRTAAIIRQLRTLIHTEEMANA
jgi:hypothetical protein